MARHIYPSTTIWFKVENILHYWPVTSFWVWAFWDFQENHFKSCCWFYLVQDLTYYSQDYSNKKVFPLSAMISCCSLAIILNWSYDFHNLFLPVFICIASKYIFTLNGKHFFNPSLFAICFCLLFGGEFVTLAPSYQWYGSAQSAWVMMYFVATNLVFYFSFLKSIDLG